MTSPLRVGTFSPSILVRLARETGALSRHGLEVAEVPVPSSPAQFRSLRAGDLDVALTSPDNVLVYRFLAANPIGGRLDVRIVLAVDRGLGLSLFGRAGIDSTAAVGGGVVGVDVSDSGFAYAGYELLARAGLRRDVDYRVVELGSTPGRLRSLLAGECDATMLNAGNDLRAEDAGLNRLARITGSSGPYLGTVLAAPGAACQRRDQRIGALVAALRQTGAALLAGRHRDLAATLAAHASDMSPAAATRYVDTLVDPDEGLVPTGRVDSESLATVVGLRRRHQPHAPAGVSVGAGTDADSTGTAESDPGLVDTAFLPDD
ncbi:MAG TPA: PhnD/SsuA/transferrin family substrate-binding protein [Mycobacteriales bacterium]|nr:PhnD/SsuA/transferrin family substrate-binding protein [Mycobacteriales bacterium]